MKKQSVFTEFKEFISQGNILDLAVAVILGAAFTQIIKSLVDGILMPIIAMVFGQPNFQAWSVGALQVGLLINAVLNFIFIAIGLFIIVKAAKKVQDARKKEAPAEETFELTEIALLEEIRDLLKSK